MLRLMHTEDTCRRETNLILSIYLDGILLQSQKNNPNIEIVLVPGVSLSSALERVEKYRRLFL